MSTISDQLRALLGAESKGAWIRFMDLILDQLPFLVKVGRPSKRDIANSSIGLSGFTSWTEMVTAPSHQHGLAWNVSQWKQWRRAFGFVLRYPYLRELELTASEIVRMANHSSDRSPFPPDKDTWIAVTEKRRADSESKRIHSLADAKKVAERAVQQAEDAQKQVVVLNNTLTELNKTLLVANKRVEEVELLLTESTKERDQYKRIIVNYQKLSFWQRMFTPI